MNIKKITAAVMAVTILAGMTACSDTANETAEVSETTTIAEITTVVEETTTTAEETVAETTEETTTATEEVTIEIETETETAVEFTSEGFTYVTDNVVDTADKIPAEWLVSAEACLNGNERYERFVNYDPAYEDTFPDVSDVFPPLVEFEDYLDGNGTAKAKFTNGIVGDFNGNGKNEAFVVLGTPYFYTENGGSEGGPDFLVYINENGEAQLLTQGYCIAVDGKLDYNGFSHVFLYMGDNNASNRSLVCSTDGINAKVEIEYNWSVIIDDENNRLLKNMQVYREEMEFKGYKWNDNSNCYSDITISYDEFIEAIK